MRRNKQLRLRLSSWRSYNEEEREPKRKCTRHVEKPALSRGEGVRPTPYLRFQKPYKFHQDKIPLHNASSRDHKREQN